MELGSIMAENRSNYLVALGSNLEDEGTTPLEILQTCLAEFHAEGLDLFLLFHDSSRHIASLREQGPIM